MKCSYLGVLLGHLGEIFGTIDGMMPFYGFQQLMPDLFPSGSDEAKIAVREQFQVLNLLETGFTIVIIANSFRLFRYMCIANRH